MTYDVDSILNLGKVVVLDLECTCWDKEPPINEVMIGPFIVRRAVEDVPTGPLVLTEIESPLLGDQKWRARFDLDKRVFIDMIPGDAKSAPLFITMFEGIFDKERDLLMEMLMGPRRMKPEIIEVGVCLLTTSTLEISRPRRIFVKPVRSTVSEFCTQLTGITPEILEEKGKTREQALDILLDEYKLNQRAWAGWGSDGLSLVEGLNADAWLGKHASRAYFNLSLLFSLVANQGRRVGLLDALKIIGKEPMGVHHSGGDDAYNAAQILRWMIERLRDAPDFGLRHDPRAVEATYTNWKGETEPRRFVPQRVYFGSTQFHPEDQWLVEALDLDRNEMRTFAMKDFQGWKPKGKE